MEYYIEISFWFGRYGNNILQIIRAIDYALKEKNITHIILPKHKLLNNTTIKIKENKSKKLKLKDIFYYFGKDMEKYEYRIIYEKYVKELIILNENLDIKQNELYIHMRGGDIFTGNEVHPKYLQPPLIFYENIMKNYISINIFIISEDKKNPLINHILEKYPGVNFISSSIEKDFNLLSHAKNLVLSNSTFSFIAFLNNKDLEKLYIPEFKFSFPEGIFPVGKWKNENENFNCIEIKLPGYYEQWKNTEEQRKKMIEYKINNI